MRKLFQWQIAVFFAASFLLIGSLSVQAQQPTQSSALGKPISSPPARSNDSSHGPRFTAYKGVSIGMSADEARQKLGKPRDKDKTQDLYVFSDNESAQIFYDDKQQVYAISIDYTGKDSPAPIDILGQDVTAKQNGSIYQLQQYDGAGYWVSYNRTAGNSPTVTVTMQKIPGSK